MHNHPVDDLVLFIYLGVEGHGFGELGVEQWPEAWLECVDKSTIPIWDNGLWDSKMYPDSFKEDFGNGLYSDALLASNLNHHLRKAINNHKNTVISPPSGREAQNIVHRYGFPWPIKSRKRSVQALFLDGWFNNSVGGAWLNILADILLKFRPVEMLL